MNRVNQILSNKKFKTCIDATQQFEKGRIFCKHDLEHLFSVCRIAYILNLEGNCRIAKDVIYGAGLLHDIGKHEQYQGIQPHHEASAVIARDILPECGYSEAECNDIVSAILTHRSEEAARKHLLNQLLYKADKLSRACYCCPARDECDWDDSKKNMNCSL